MSRVAEMIDYLKDDIEQGLEEWKLKILNINDIKVKEAFATMKTKVETDDACIVITYLRSSYITGTHQFKIALYENEPFISEPTLHKLVNLSPLFTRVSETIDKFTRKIKSQFIRVLSHEIEGIRRFHMEYLYQNSYYFFEKVTGKTGDDEGSIPVYFGEEMGEINQIGVIYK